MIGDLKDRYKNSMIAGGAFGFALVLSLRRYFPATFTGFTVNRFLIESLIIGGSLFGSTMSVILGGSKFIHHVKKDYILKADPDIYKQMDLFYRRYRVS